MRNTNCETAKCGCVVEVSEETLQCSAKGCGNDDLCKGCAWMCAQCGGDFCESHVIDMKDFERYEHLTGGYSYYACLACHEGWKFERKAA